MKPSINTWTVEGSDAGVRLDLFLGRRLGLSRVQVRRLLGSAAVTVDGRAAGDKQKGLVLPTGARVCVEGFEGADAGVVAEPGVPLNVLAEGNGNSGGGGWVAVDKPSGVAVHPLEAGECGTVLNALIARYPRMQGVGEAGLRSGVVHRLDVDTSGVLLFATDEPTWRRLRDAFIEHRTKKIYRAILLGQLRGQGREVLDLIVTRHKPAKVRVVSQGDRKFDASRRCDLTWKAIETFDNATLIEVSLGTGFLHQIRATFAHLGHPVGGDPIYGVLRESDPTAAPRLMLHAAKLEVEGITAESPDPADFAHVLDQLRRKR